MSRINVTISRELADFLKLVQITTTPAWHEIHTAPFDRIEMERPRRILEDWLNLREQLEDALKSDTPVSKGSKHALPCPLHNACGQHYIDTGETRCIVVEECPDCGYPYPDEESLACSACGRLRDNGVENPSPVGQPVYDELGRVVGRLLPQVSRVDPKTAAWARRRLDRGLPVPREIVEGLAIDAAREEDSA